MKYKKIMLILIAAIFLVSIAGVCAADANDTMVASEDTQMDLAQIDETDELGVNDDNQEIEQSENEEIIAQEDVGLSQELQNNITAVALEKNQDSDDECLGNPSSAADLTAGKTTPNIDLVVENITYGEVETITAFTEATGNVTIKINNQLEGTFDIDQGKVVHQVHLDAGRYTVELTYNGDDNYNNVTIGKEFSVYKANVSMDVEAEPYIDAGEIQTINITMSSANATGHVNVYLAGAESWRPLFDGRGNFTTPALDSGKHQYVIIYEGDKNFNGTLHHGTFEVGVPSKMPVSFNVSVQDVDVGENAIVKILNLPDNATGYMVIKLNETGYGFDIDSNREFSIPINKAGTYEVFAAYTGDAMYDSGNASTSFRASKIKSKVIVEVDNLTYGGVAHINITVTTGATGNVTIKIGDEFNQTVGVVGGLINVAVPGLTGGNKTVEVTYNGNDMYLSNSNSTDFTVGSAIAKMYLFTQNVTYGENETIIAYLDAEGNVTFKIDGQDYGTVIITDGKAVFTGPLESGKHTVKAVYNGGPNFSSNSIEAKFTVEKAIPTVSVEVQNIIFGGVEHIRVHVNAEGDVTIKVIGTGIVETISLENGEKDIILRGISSSGSDNYEGNATLNVYNLRGGRYPVEVTYLGNSNYKNLTVFSEFEVYKADTSMYIEAEPYIDAGDDQTINITLSSVKATGWVYVYLAGRVSPRPVFDGFANYTTPLLESGKYQYVIVYEGDENFNSYIARGTFEVGDVPSLNDVSIGLDVEPYLHAGETQVINITMSDSLATGRVTIILDNNNYTRILDNGVANFTTPVLPGGNYTVVVIYEGNYMFNSNWTYSEFVVEKITHEESPLDVTVDNIEVGGTAIVIVGLPKNATGNVTVSIDGVSHTTSNITDGIARFEIENLTAGNKTIAVVYSGDDDYVANSTIANMVVSKVVPDVSIDVTTVGDSVIVNVTVPVDVAAPVLVAVDGVGYQVNITGGKGQLVVSGLAGGKHNVTAGYAGDDKYESCDVGSKSAEIVELPSFVSVKVDNITYGDKAVIEVTVPADAAGNVTVTIGGKSYTENVSSARALLIVAGLGAGNYTVNVTYNGDVKYASGSNFTNLEVSKAKTSIKVIDNGNGNVIVVVSDNVRANVTIKSGNNTYEAVGEDSIAIIDLVNETPGVHDIEVFCAGDENHTAAYANASITINKIKTQITANAITTTYNVNKNMVISLKDVKGNPISGAKIAVDLNGVKTYTTDKNGKIKVSIKGLALKSYTAKITFNGNDTYEKSMKSVKVSVKKATPKITAKKKTFKAKTKTKKYTITLKDNTGKAMKKAKVTLKVKGKTYKATTNSKGKATFKIKNLKKKGKFTAVIKFKGDKYYKKVTKKVKLTVKASKKKKSSKTKSTFKTLSKGSKDKATIKKIQQALKNNGYYLTYDGKYLKIDGIYHGCTERSVKEFQHDKGLKVTGKVDEKTAKKLGII